MVFKRPTIRKRIFSYLKKGRRPKRRGARGRKGKSNIPRGVSTYANINPIQRHRYVTHVSINPGAGSIAKIDFGANCMHQPNLTSNDHQPMRWDQLKLFYNHYIVIGSKISATKIGGAATNADSVISAWGIYLQDSTVSATSYTTLIEQGRTAYTITNASVAARRSTLRKGFSTKKFFNISRISDNVDRLGAPNTANPSDIAVFTLWSQAIAETLDPPAETYLIMIDFIVMYSEPTDLAES